MGENRELISLSHLSYAWIHSQNSLPILKTSPLEWLLVYVSCIAVRRYVADVRGLYPRTYCMSIDSWSVDGGRGPINENICGMVPTVRACTMVHTPGQLLSELPFPNLILKSLILIMF